MTIERRAFRVRPEVHHPNERKRLTTSAKLTDEHTETLLAVNTFDDTKGTEFSALQTNIRLPDSDTLAITSTVLEGQQAMIEKAQVDSEDIDPAEVPKEVPVTDVFTREQINQLYNTPYRKLLDPLTNEEIEFVWSPTKPPAIGS